MVLMWIFAPFSSKGSSVCDVASMVSIMVRAGDSVWAANVTERVGMVWGLVWIDTETLFSVISGDVVGA